jgi:hypothetical protein
MSLRAGFSEVLCFDFAVLIRRDTAGGAYDGMLVGEAGGRL